MSAPLLAALAARRHDLDVTQQELAIRLGVSRDYLSRVEHGRGRSPRLELVLAYAGAVGAVIGVELLGVDETKTEVAS